MNHTSGADVAVVVLTLNPGQEWHQWIDAYRRQSVGGTCLVIDSSSDDDTVGIAQAAGCRTEVIQRADFDHGGTRNLGLALTTAPVIVFMTQDAILENEHSIEQLVAVFDDPQVAAVYGRQLPRTDADPFEAFLRIQNYSDRSYVRTLEDREQFGLRTAFMSNSFAAYRRDAIDQIDGFPEGQIFGEDMVAAAKMLKRGGKVAYAADARVFHSHRYTPAQEFSRYFDMGVLHAHHPWLRAEFGAAEKAGVRFVFSELAYLCGSVPWRIPEAFIRTLLRFIGFKLGVRESYLPLRLKRLLAMNQGFFT